MAKIRKVIPQPVQNAVLKEFNHRCAFCGKDRPHLHHIDEDPSNNDALNIIPLCPNCHVTDQHDASNAIPIAKNYDSSAVTSIEISCCHSSILYFGGRSSWVVSLTLMVPTACKSVGMNWSHWSAI